MITEKKFKEFVKVKESGKYNMFDKRARTSTSLNINQWLDVMSNFKEYDSKWGEE
jgi:hypothetical protein